MRQQESFFLSYIVLLVLNVLSAIIYNLFNETLALIPMRVGAAIINGAGFTLIVILIIHLIYRFFRINFFIPILFVEAFVLMIESFLLLNFYCLITPSAFLVLLETNSDEITEFFQTYFNYPTWILFVIWLFIIGLCVKYNNKIQNIQLTSLGVRKKSMIILCLLIIISYMSLVYYVSHIRKMTSYQMLTGIERIWHSARGVMIDRSEQLRYFDLIKKEAPIISTPITQDSKIPYVVVILNESISKLHMNAYGYPRMTTPLLNERIKNQDITLFYHVQTPRAGTAESIRKIMTLHDESDVKEWYQCYTLPSIMKAAGYYTIWLSNQDSFTHGSDNSTQSIAATSDTVVFTHHRHASEERFGYFDGDLLPLLDKQLRKNIDFCFVCLHLMGAHQRYTNRFPSSFKRFDIGESHTELSRSQQQTVAEYDNCILYTDYVCDEILRRFESDDAIVFCFPDHGEEVFDTRNMCGHSPWNSSDPMINIPFWIWTSELFKSRREDIVKRIRQSAQTPFNTSNLVHSVMDLCGLQCEEYDETKSLFYPNQFPNSQ